MIALNGGIYDLIYFNDIDFKETLVDFDGCSVKEVLAIQARRFNKPIGANQFNFPLNNTSFYWDQIKAAGIGLYYDYAQLPFHYHTDSLISDVYI